MPRIEITVDKLGLAQSNSFKNLTKQIQNTVVSANQEHKKVNCVVLACLSAHNFCRPDSVDGGVSETSKMDRLVKKVNDFDSLTIFTKPSILDV